MVSRLPSWTYGSELPTIVGLVLTVVISALSIDGPRWERKFSRAHENYEDQRLLVDLHYVGRPTTILYDNVPSLTLESRVRNRRERLYRRALLVGDMPAGMRSEAGEVAKAWLHTVGRFAQQAAVVYRLPLRPFFATFHLGVIREGAIAIPIALDMVSSGELAEDETELLAWGMALVDLATLYNSVARQQRRAVFFAAHGHERPVGPVLNAPRRWAGLMLDVGDRASVLMKLRRWRRVRRQRLISRLSSRIREAKLNDT